MLEAKLNIEVEFCGHRGIITHIGGRDAYPPWNPEDELCVYVDFDEPYPENIVSTAITIRAKEYSPKELLAEIKKQGERQIAQAIAKAVREREDSAIRQQRREKLNALIKRTEEILRV